MRRRLEKRIYIPLPDLSARRSAFELHLKECALGQDVELDELSVLTDGYSGSDIRLVCREAAMMPMRRILAETQDPSEIARLKQDGQLDTTITLADLKEAVESTNPSVDPET